MANIFRYNLYNYLPIQRPKGQGGTMSGLLEKLREKPLEERRIVRDALIETVMSPSPFFYEGLAAELFGLLETEFHQIAAEALAEIPQWKRRNLLVTPQKIAALKEKFDALGPTGGSIRLAFPD